MGHSIFSPSASERWVACPPSVALVRWFDRRGELPDEEESDYAREGSAAHELAALALVEERDAHAYLHRVFAGFEDFPVTPEMAEAVQVHLDLVRDSIVPGDVVCVENKVPFGRGLNHPTVLRETGTADVIIFSPSRRLVHVLDYKHGKGVRVEAIENTQLQVYAIGALAVLPVLCEPFEVERVVTTIVQPRLDNISDDEYTPGELRARAQKFNAAISEADRHTETLFVSQDPTTLVDEVRPSREACRWCPVVELCPAHAASLDAAMDEWDDVDEALSELEEHPSDTAHRQELDTIASWYQRVSVWKLFIDRVSKRAYQLVKSGQRLPEHKMVSGRKGDRTWTDPGAVLQLLRAAKLDEEDIWVRKLVSPSQAQQILKGKPKTWEKLKDYITQPDGAPKLVHISDAGEEIEIGVSDDDLEDLD